MKTLKNSISGNESSAVRNSDIILMTVLFLAGTFVYFRLFSGYILFFQEQQSLFTFTGDYIREFFLKPGGILELAGKFLTQFYADKFAGSLILSIILTLPIPLIFLSGKNKSENTTSNFLLYIPSSLLLLMQTHYYHLMEFNLGFVFVLIFYHFIKRLLKEKKLLILLVFPIIYYVLGSFSWLFLAIYIFNYVFGSQNGKFLFSALALAESILIPFLFKKYLFLGSYKVMFSTPWPFINNNLHNTLLIICLIYLPIIFVINNYYSNKVPAIFKRRKFNLLSGAFIMFLGFSFLVKLTDTQTDNVVQMEEMVTEGKYNEAIDYQEKEASGNLISQYFYNISLAETDQLCDRLFFGRQDFGTGALILPWGDKHLSWGAYFFYEAGLANEAERWAYEEMVTYGQKPQNILMLVKTNIVNRNYRMAEKYIKILKNTIYYSREAIAYEKMISDTSFLTSDISAKMKIQPGKDFFIYVDSAENNLPQLVNTNMRNTKAYEYLMSWLMLNKNVEAVVNNTALLKKMGYSRIPRHIEEAILMYHNSTGKFPNLGGLTLSRDSQERFSSYFNTYIKARNNPSSLKEIMRSRFGNTYWYYYHFS